MFFYSFVRFKKLETKENWSKIEYIEDDIYKNPHNCKLKMLKLQGVPHHIRLSPIFNTKINP